MSQAEGLAAVILHYGRADQTRRLHEQLRESDPGFAGLFVLDNHAPEPYPGAWLRTDENLYWTGAFDLAARLMAKEGASHLWFMNNDIFFLSRPPLLARAWARLRKLEQTVGRVGMYAPAVDKSPYHPQMIADPRFQYRLISVMDGVAPLVSLDCLKEIGGLDFADNPRGYGVDMELSMRMKAAGWALVVDHQCVVRHAYHSAARTEPGFLEAAAAAEAAYLEKRLGPDYRKRVAAAKRECINYETFQKIAGESAS